MLFDVDHHKKPVMYLNHAKSQKMVPGTHASSSSLAGALFRRFWHFLALNFVQSVAEWQSAKEAAFGKTFC